MPQAREIHDRGSQEEVSDFSVLLVADEQSEVDTAAGWLVRSRSTTVLSIAFALLLACVCVAAQSILPHWLKATSLTGMEGKSDFFQCDVCSVGNCDRGLDPDGPCVWFPPPEDPKGAYHCSVTNCSDVPKKHSSSQSDCWQYNGNSYYSIFDKSAACLVKDASAEEEEEEEEPETTRKHTLRSTRKLTSTSTRTTTTSRTTAASTTTSSSKATTTRTTTATATATTTSRTTTSQTATTTTTAKSIISIFAQEAAKIAHEAEMRRPDLTAYWDLGTCGPMGEKGDDYNNEWCGGWVEKPVCKPIVHVNATTCASTKAQLAYVSGAFHGEDARTWIGGCEFMYFAQYECIASTTTTTSLTSTTRTATSSTTSTSSSTSSSSTTSSSSSTSSSSTTATSSTTSSSSSSSSSTTSGTNTTTGTTTTSSTSSSTPEEGSCPQPVLGQSVDVSDCAGLFPPNATCVVRCAKNYIGGEETFSCSDDEEGFVGVAPLCLSTTTTTTSSTRSSTTSSTSTTRWSTTAKMEGWLLNKERQLELDLRRKSNESNKTNWSASAGFPPKCNHRFKVPDPPLLAPDFNGIHVPPVCFEAEGPHYVYIIGDWGGTMTPTGPKPANQRAPHTEVKGVDDRAQQRVAAQMAWRAKHGRAPDYILNVGDNFYWAGIDLQCGAFPAYQIMPTGQFHWNFEMIYVGEGIDGKPWLSVLGNHDYGGYMFNKGWDQQISYTWSPQGRWMMPAQYWSTKVHYPGFSVDYFFLDTNHLEAHHPDADPAHNICSKDHVKTNASGGCGKEGPVDVWDCPGWFQRLWDAQEPWLERGLDKAVGDWQILVTHFPPVWKRDYWIKVSRQYGVDLIVTGHMHKLDVHTHGAENFLAPTAWLVSGGGGGITSEGFPDPQGFDDQYGFHELTLSKEVIEIQGISHGGIRRSLDFVKPVPRADGGNSSGKSSRSSSKKANATVEHKENHKKKQEDHHEKKETPKPKKKSWFFKK